ncbi:hypothetical protein [Tsukamurella paurometabola]|uniref:DUF5642 domain-containing protein n=1 Tax=Tsukamurella paurometabola TaxID=2061 RepID=A0ABS5N8K2_TSUPA|nr:hypothetical protein [Tsukamurella paurometabola]MBS4100323.1 hypothetical protein [Tsukamurella paurometabola]
MGFRNVTVAAVAAATAALAALMPATAQAEPNTVTCSQSPDVGAPSTAGGLFGTAPLTFPAALVGGWDLDTGYSAGAATTAAARYSPGGNVMNLVEVGRLRVSPGSHATTSMALAFSLCRFPDRSGQAQRTTTDRRARPVVIDGVKGTRLDLNANTPQGAGGAPESDWFTIIVLDTTPTSYFLGGANKTNTDARGKVDAVIRALQVR